MMCLKKAFLGMLVALVFTPAAMPKAYAAQPPPSAVFTEPMPGAVPIIEQPITVPLPLECRMVLMRSLELWIVAYLLPQGGVNVVKGMHTALINMTNASIPCALRYYGF